MSSTVLNHILDAERFGEPDNFQQLDNLIADIPEALLNAPDHPFVSAEMSADPESLLGPIRDAHGFVLSDADGRYDGVELYNVFGHDLSKPHALALSYGAVSTIALAPQRFQSSSAYGTHEQIQGHTVNTTDGIEHRMLRQVLETKVFGQRAIERWFTETTVPTAEFLILRLARKLRAGEVCDFRREVALPLIFRSIAAVIGIPVDGMALFVEQGEIAQSAPRFPKEAEAAVAEMNAYFWEIFARRKREPRNDLMSLLIEAAAEGYDLSDATIVDHCRFLVPGGIETTWRQAANIMYALMIHPDQYAAIVANRGLIDAAVEEGIRWQPSANTSPRLASADTEVLGTPILAGTGIVSILGIANRDPKRWERANDFDIFREQKRHMTFHAGIHHCIGHVFARSTFREMLRLCLEHLPDMRLAVNAHEINMHGFVIRCPDGLPVTLR